jgi:hypothetical protein
MMQNEKSQKIYRWLVLPIALGMMLCMFAPALGYRPESITTKDHPARAPSCYIREDQSYILIGNGIIELKFDIGGKGGLDRITDVSTGIDLRGDKEVPPTLFALFYDTGSGMDAAIQWDALTVTYENSSSTSECTLYINNSQIKGYDLGTSVMVKVEEGSSLVRMRIKVLNDDDIVLKYIFFPLVWGMGSIGSDQEDDVIFFPTGDGIILKDPLSFLDTLYFSDMYPAGLSMQFMCHYDPDEAGLYAASYDMNGSPKKLNMVSLDWGGEKRLASYFQLYCPEYPGNDLVMDYDAILGTFHGDWYDAADIYKEWAHTTPFVSDGKVGLDKDTPQWWYNTSIVSYANRDRDVIHNSLPSIVDMTREMSALTGLNTTALVFAWEHHGGWVGPNFFPPAEGESEFISAMDDLDSSGDKGFVYLSGTVWRITRSEIGYSNWSYFNETGKQWAALTESGDVLIDQNYATIGWQSARMCPCTEFWHEMVVDNVLECIRLGIDVVQIDEFPIGTMYPCYNASHGHPIGHSRDMSSALIAILEDIRTKGRLANPDLILSAEEPCELYIPYLDTYVSRDNAEEYMLYPFAKQAYVDSIQFVPAFGYVYHEYITGFGEPIFLGESYPDFFNDQIKRGLARSLVQGEVMSAGGEEEMWPELLELYDRTARASATYANEYVVKGSMISPPQIDVPLKQVPWYFTSIGRFGNPFNESVVVNGAWKAPDGDIGHVLVNWNDSAEEFDLQLDPYDLGPGNWSIIEYRNGIKKVLFNSVELPIIIHMVMDPNDVVLVEITRAPDLFVTESDVQIDGPIMTDDTVEIRINVKNQGTMETGQFDLDLSLGGIGALGTIPVSSIPAEGYVTVPFLWDTTGLVGSFDLSFHVDAGGFVSELSEDNNGVSFTVDVLERPRSRLNITVIDALTSDPVPDCNVILLWRINETLERTAKTDTYGKCSLVSLKSGSYSLIANRSGYYGSGTYIDIAEGKDRTSMVELWPIPVFYGIKGTVTDNGTNENISGAELILKRVGPFLQFGTNSSEIGSFSFTGIPKGEYILEAVKEGYQNVTLSLNFSGDVLEQEIVIKMDPIPPEIEKGGLRGIVRDQITKIVIEDVLVRIVPLDRSVMTDLDGSFNFDDVPVGTYTLNFTADEYNSKEIPVTIVSGRDVCYNVTLTRVEGPSVPKGRITGFITDDKGDPVVGARIKDEMNDTAAVSGAEGSYSITDLDPGVYSYTVSAEGFYPKETGEIHVNGNTVMINVTLVPIVIISGDGEEMNPLFVLGIFAAIVLVSVLIFLLARSVRRRTENGMDEE